MTMGDSDERVRRGPDARDRDERDGRLRPEERHDPHAAVLERLSDHLDGELDEISRAEVDAHLEACPTCRATREDLRRVVSAARGLGERLPPRDLWPGIAAVLTPRSDARQVPVPSVQTRRGEPAVRRLRGRLLLTVPQLAAAAVLLVVLASSATWWAGTRRVLPDGTYGSGAVESGGAAGGGSPGPVRAAGRPAGIPEPMAEELAALEAALDSGRTVLDPNTVLVLERNLAVIERAIADSRAALALDPGSDFLESHLERAYERKLEYLRDVSRIVALAG